MAKNIPTLEQLARDVERLDNEQVAVDATLRLLAAGLPGKGFVDEWIRQARKQELRVIPGGGKRRTARRGKLRLVS